MCVRTFVCLSLYVLTCERFDVESLWLGIHKTSAYLPGTSSITVAWIKRL